MSSSFQLFPHNEDQQPVALFNQKAGLIVRRFRLQEENEKGLVCFAITAINWKETCFVMRHFLHKEISNTIYSQRCLFPPKSEHTMHKMSFASKTFAQIIKIELCCLLPRGKMFMHEELM